MAEARRTEYATTYGQFSGPTHSIIADDPEVPKGDGWRLVTATADPGQALLFWFWEREAKP